MTLVELLRRTTGWLTGQGSASARLDAELLLSQLLGLDRVQLYTSFDRPMSEDELAAYRSVVRRRGTGEPIAYILGDKEFYSRDFMVDPRVLIPRPDTETLVDAVLDLLPEAELQGPVLDYGTGSGAIAITLACERPVWKVLALDRSAEALIVAKENAAKHEVVGRVGFLHSDGLSHLPKRFIGQIAAIVANPPYIPLEDRARLPRDVRDFEPEGALHAGPDPLLHYRRLASEGPRWLADHGLLALEVGQGQAADVLMILEQNGWTDLASRQDLAGIDRVVCARRP